MVMGMLELYLENGVKQQLVLLPNLLDICNFLLYKELQGFSVLWALQIATYPFMDEVYYRDWHIIYVA